MIGLSAESLPLPTHTLPSLILCTYSRCPGLRQVLCIRKWGQNKSCASTRGLLILQCSPVSSLMAAEKANKWPLQEVSQANILGPGLTGCFSGQCSTGVPGIRRLHIGTILDFSAGTWQLLVSLGSCCYRINSRSCLIFPGTVQSSCPRMTRNLIYRVLGRWRKRQHWTIGWVMSFILKGRTLILVFQSQTSNSHTIYPSLIIYDCFFFLFLYHGNLIYDLYCKGNCAMLQEKWTGQCLEHTWLEVCIHTD